VRLASAGTGGCASRFPARASGRAWSCSARTAASPRSSFDDLEGKTLASAGWTGLKKSFKGNKTAQAAEVGKALAASAKSAGIESVVFDRGGYLYHGRVKALADAAREGGLRF
jgi:large subunit ribosomal protein L18